MAIVKNSKIYLKLLQFEELKEMYFNKQLVFI